MGVGHGVTGMTLCSSDRDEIDAEIDRTPTLARQAQRRPEKAVISVDKAPFF